MFKGHLHVHTTFSPLDGMASVDELVRRAKELGQVAIAVTDHGSTSGLYNLKVACKKYGIKPIYGSEFYFNEDDHIGHIVLLAKNNKGMENLFLLQEYAYTKGFYKKPALDFKILQQYSSDLICTSACIGNQIPKAIIHGKPQEAIDYIEQFKDIFKDDFYLEVQPNSILEQEVANKALVKLGASMGIKVIATNDVHYTYRGDANVHEVVLAMQQNKTMNDPKRWKFPAQDFWLKSEEEMRKGFNYFSNQIIDDILDVSEVIDKCNAELVSGNYIPKYPTPPDMTEEQMLRKAVTTGYKDVYMGKGKHTKELADKIANELDVIERNGYSGYHLIVADYVNFARENGIIVGDGRGSGAGCRVAYTLGITKVDPEEYGLLFERFLVDGRQPDYDVDFSDSDAVFEHMKKKYGARNVARIISFGTLTPKAGVRKVFSAFDHPASLVAQINGCMPQRPSFKLKEAYAESSQLVKYREKYRTEFDVIERLEGMITHESMHAGGVIVCEDLPKYLPIKTLSEDRTKYIACFDMDMLKELGHVKFDLLWLENLKTIQDSIDLIYQEEGVEIDTHEIDLNDPKVYDMLCGGDLSGVFQLAEQSHKVVEQQPRNFKDIIAINALIRPGVGDWDEYIARRKGKPYEIHEKQKWYMEETFGTIAYQEQFMLDCHIFAGWDLAFVDKKVRKNKDIRNDKELAGLFLADCTRRGYDVGMVESLWEEVIDAVDGGYSFNKSHATAYGVMSYVTAWLKCYYPQYFYACLMNAKNNKSTGDAQKLISNLMAECKKKDLTILPPDVNESQDSYTVSKEGIRYCITTIKNVGESAVEGIKELRPIKSLTDMLQRGAKKVFKTNVVPMLIKSGCFDFENPNRVELLHQFETLRKLPLTEKEWNDKTRMEFEKESLGMYLSKHPLDKYSFKHLDEFSDGSQCLVAGEVIEVSTRYDKKGGLMAFVTLGTPIGNIKCMVFSSTWCARKSTIQSDMAEGNIIMVRGKRSKDSCLVDSVEVLK